MPVKAKTKEIAMPFFETEDNTRLFYSVWGSGRPILLIHGGNVGSDIWTFQLSPLIESGYRCIVYDQRAFGRSDCPAGGYDFDTLASDLNQLIHHLNLPKLSIMTFSFGAGVLSRYLSLYGSGLVESAVLIAPITPFFLRTADNPEGLERATAYEPFRAGMLEDRPKLFRDSLDALFPAETAEQPVSDEMKAWIIGSALQAPLMPMLELYRTSSETDFRGDMKCFTMPTLIVHGDADVFVPAPSTGLRTHAMIAGSTFLSYAGASHGILFTHRERINRDVAGFLGSVEGTA
jgi:non-heme chloroperoxidase